MEKLRREGKGFAATVRGSRPYTGALHRGPAGSEFSCSRPYAFDGICKHKVALGLAVLDAYGAELISPNPTTAPPLADQALATAIKAAWADHRKGDKLRFLKQALAKNDDLTRQFLGFGQPADAPANTLANLPTRLTDTLGVLNFDEDF